MSSGPGCLVAYDSSIITEVLVMKQQYLVAGLGRFGSSVARTLYGLGHEVLGIDLNERLCEDLKTEITHVVQGDATDLDVLRAIDIEQFEAAVVAIGTHFEASVLTTLRLKQVRVPYILAKAVSWEQVQVLQLTGAHRVIFPEEEAGEHAAYRLLNRHLVDYLRLDATVSVVAIEVGSWVGTNLADVERQSGLTALGVFRAGRMVAVADSDPLAPQDKLVLAGHNSALQALTRMR
ncbi:MAG: TrkA family potassium uptake protein [Chloroflexota bacterium]|nr:TrkA family potassium uptake protein [Chloroflexota bacterium]